jgi:hypothetical protein
MAIGVGVSVAIDTIVVENGVTGVAMDLSDSGECWARLGSGDLVGCRAFCGLVGVQRQRELRYVLDILAFIRMGCMGMGGIRYILQGV